MDNFLELMELLWATAKIAISFLMLAYMVERAVEFVVGKFFDLPVVPESWRKWKCLIPYVGLAVGIYGAFVYNLDFMSVLGEVISEPIQKTQLGITLTGVMIGGGSELVHEIIKKFLLKPK